MNLITHYEA